MSDAEYFAERAQQELRAATSDRRVRQIHLELADAYAFRLREAKRVAPAARMLAAETGQFQDLMDMGVLTIGEQEGKAEG